MPASISILFGAALTIATAWALGAILFRKLAIAFSRLEYHCLAFVAGSACLSAIDFVLAATHLVHKVILLAIAAASIGYAFFSGAHRSSGKQASGKQAEALPRVWKLMFVTVFGAFTVLYFFNAMAPEMSPDGATYHLGEVAMYHRAHGFVRITNNICSNFPQGLELLFLHAFEYGKHSAAALVHFTYLLSLAFLLLSYGRRIGHPIAGAAASLFLYCSPIVGQDGTVAYNDVAVAAILFAVFYLLQVWDQERNPRLLLAVGILAGFGFAVKYTAGLAIPYAFGFIAWKQWRSRKPVLRTLLWPALLATLFIAPWLVKNWMWVENPVSPFANRLFPNPYVHISFEESFSELQRSYGLTSKWQIPVQTTIKGDLLGGFLGPLFLLTPLGLLALRSRTGRQLWLAAVVFGLPYAANIGTRFLIPAAPFLSLALALALSNLPWLLLALAAVHSISCWPAISNMYCGAAWRLNGIPIRAALRIEPEDKFLREQSLAYAEARMIEQLVPPGQRVFAFSPTGQAYTSREISVSYMAAPNEVLHAALLAALFPGLSPSRQIEFHFSPAEVRKIRAVQTAQAKVDQWGIFEMRVYRGEADLARSPEWRLTANPNSWDVQLAFDNSEVTRWRSWQTAAPGMYVEIDLGRAQTIDAVSIESGEEGYQAKIRIDGMDAQGNWRTLSDQPQESVHQPRGNLRRAAAAQLKLHGYRYLLVGQDDTRSNDFAAYQSIWGIKQVGVAGTSRLYEIE